MTDQKQRARHHFNAILAIGRRFLLPYGLRYDPKHSATIQTKPAGLNAVKVVTANVHEIITSKWAEIVGRSLSDAFFA